MGFDRGYECGKCSRPRKLCYSSQVRVRAFVLLARTRSGRSAAWLARLVRDQEVEGSNPFAPTTSFRTNNLQTRMHPLTAWCRPRRSAFQGYLALLQWFVAEHLFASNLGDLRSAESNSERAAISMGDGVVRLNVRVRILIAITAVLVFATPAYMRDASRLAQEEQTKPPKTKPPIEPPPRVIAMTAKDFEFDPA